MRLAPGRVAVQAKRVRAGVGVVHVGPLTPRYPVLVALGGIGLGDFEALDFGEGFGIFAGANVTSGAGT